MALAWLLGKGADIAPIPGPSRVAQVEENTAADAVELTAEQNGQTRQPDPPAGDHRNEARARNSISTVAILLVTPVMFVAVAAVVVRLHHSASGRLDRRVAV